MQKKVILITGASSGIGQATASRLIDKGHIVYGSGRREEDLRVIEQMGGIPVQVEMTDYDTLAEAVDKVIGEQGRIDVLFNNAGFGLYGAVEDIPMEKAKFQFEVNLFGLARITQLVLPHMRRQKSGTIINTSSMGGKIYTPLGAWYHATKHALEGWSDCLRLEVQQFGIDVVIIEPGMINTNFGATVFAPLMETSGKGAYKELVEKMVSGAESGDVEKMSSSPLVIAEAVVQAIHAKKPKTRYVAGKMARLLMAIRRYGGDKLYDKFIMKSFVG